VRGEVHTAAADARRVDQRLLLPCGLRRLVGTATERLREIARRWQQVAVDPRRILVVTEVRCPAPRTLLEHEHFMACGRQLLRQNSAGGAGADDEKVDGLVLRERALPHAAPPVRRYSSS